MPRLVSASTWPKWNILSRATQMTKTMSLQVKRGVLYHPLGDPAEKDSYREPAELLKFSTVYDLDGRLVARSVRTYWDGIVQPNPFADRDPDDEEWENTGNEGVASR